MKKELIEKFEAISGQSFLVIRDLVKNSKAAPNLSAKLGDQAEDALADLFNHNMDKDEVCHVLASVIMHQLLRTKINQKQN